MPGIFAEAPWKIENNCVLNHPVSGRPITGKRIYSSSGFLVAEVYLCDEKDLAKIESAPELYAALLQTTTALEKFAFRLGVKKAFSELNAAACARKVLAQAEGSNGGNGPAQTGRMNMKRSSMTRQDWEARIAAAPEKDKAKLHRAYRAWKVRGRNESNKTARTNG